MPDIKWNHKSFSDKVIKNALLGLEEWALAEWKPQAVRDAPKKSGIMAGSLTVERSDSDRCVYVGGGGEAKAYILKQEMDRSLHHEVGKAGFISDTVKEKAPKLASYVQKHIDK